MITAAEMIVLILVLVTMPLWVIAAKLEKIIKALENQEAGAGEG